MRGQRLALRFARALLLAASCLLAAAPAGAQQVPAPPNLQVTAGDATLTMTWDAPTGYMFTHVWVQWRVKDTDTATSGDQAGSWLPSLPIVFLGPIGRSVLIPPQQGCASCTALENGTTYQVQAYFADLDPLRDYRSAGWVIAGEGTPQVVDPLTLRPRSPGNLQVTPGDRKLTVSWEVYAAIQGMSGPTEFFEIYHYEATASDPGWSGSHVETLTGTPLPTTYEITGLTNDVAYLVHVRAGNAYGASLFLRKVGTPGTTARTVALSVSPNPVTEGSAVTVTARLSELLGSGILTVPLTLTAGTAESGDYTPSTITDISILAGSSSSGIAITANQDADTDNETFTVALGALPTPWQAGSPSSVTVTIRDDDTGTGTGTGTGGGRGGGGGGGGGGGRQPRSTPDQHGDTPAEATSLNPRRYTTGRIQRRITARLQRRTDVDYFQLDLPHAGVLTATTTGGVDTTGRLYQAQDEGDPLLLVTDTDSGQFRHFALGVAVEPGTYYLAVSAGASFGDYRLRVDYTPAFVENPAPTSPQSGLGLLAGWVCAAVPVEIEIATPGRAPSALAPATGTTRADTAAACGVDTTDTGFGLLVNWNLLGDGEHTVRVVIDDVVFTERDISVTTLGPHPEQEYRRGLRATTAIPDFPAAGQTTTLRWAEALQNFVIASGERARGGEQLTPEQAWLENPAPGSFQSGLGVISGWVCEAERVEIAVTSDGPGEPWTVEAGAGTARADTADTCGAPDTGFGVLVNWNLLGDGQHTVRAYADGEEFAHATVTVTTLGTEFARGLRQTHTIEDFPAPGQTTTVEWQEAQQNFVITEVR